jgi:hypothetical protein
VGAGHERRTRRGHMQLRFEQQRPRPSEIVAGRLRTG